MSKGDKVVVVGPGGSAQVGKTGEVLAVGKMETAGWREKKTVDVVVVQLDGAKRPRNFQPADLKKAE